MINQINYQFDKYEEVMREFFIPKTCKRQTPFNQQNKINYFLQRLRIISNKLEQSSTVIQSIKQAYLLDQQEIFSQIQIPKYTQSKVKISFDQMRFKKLKDHIADLLLGVLPNFLEEENLINLKKEPQQIKQKVAMELKSGMTVNYKIAQPNYFQNGTKNPFAYFISGKSQITALNLKQTQKHGKYFINRINFQSQSIIPQGHKSVITPKGDIYYFGGFTRGYLYLSDVKDNKITKHWHDEIKKMQFKYRNIQTVSQLHQPTAYPAACVFKNKIFICGGILQNGQVSNTMQCYHCGRKQIKILKECNQPVSHASITLFSNKYIFKIGGFNKNKQQVQVIQMFEMPKNQWSVIDPTVQNLGNMQIGALSCAIQINPNDILIFGGVAVQKDQFYDLDNSFLFSQSLDESQYTIRNLDYKKLPRKGIFGEQPIIHNKKIYVFQSGLQSQNKQLRISFNAIRRIMSFDGTRYHLQQL